MRAPGVNSGPDFEHCHTDSPYHLSPLQCAFQPNPERVVRLVGGGGLRIASTESIPTSLRRGSLPAKVRAGPEVFEPPVGAFPEELDHGEEEGLREVFRVMMAPGSSNGELRKAFARCLLHPSRRGGAEGEKRTPRTTAFSPAKAARERAAGRGGGRANHRWSDPSPAGRTSLGRFARTPPAPGVEGLGADPAETGARNPTNTPRSKGMAGLNEGRRLRHAIAEAGVGAHAKKTDLRPPFHAVPVRPSEGDDAELEDREERQRRELFRWREEASKHSIASFVRLMLSTASPQDAAPTHSHLAMP